MSGVAGDIAALQDAAAEALRQRFRAQLGRTQWLPAAQLQAYQRQLLEPLVRHAAAQVPFYRDGRLAPILRPGGEIDLSRWHEVPLLTRQDARAAGDQLHAASVPDVTGSWAEDTTSGSTGSPFVFRRSAAASVASQGCYDRHLNWLGLTCETPFACIRVPRAAQQTQMAPAAPALNSAMQIFDSSRLDVDPLDWLARTGARRLLTYPTLARDLARRNSGRVSLETVLTFGEVLTAESRDTIATGFDAKVFDRYAAQETGLIAGECPDGGHHVQSEIHLVEIVDDNGHPAAAGAEGFVVITSFYNYVMPLIRYAIGDRATLTSEPCRCGRTLPRLRSIAGRARDMFRFANGLSVWPYIPFAKLRQYVNLREVQIAQTAQDRIEIRYVPEGAGTVRYDDLVAFVRACLHVDVAVDLVAMTSIPRSRGGKYFDYICLLDP